MLLLCWQHQVLFLALKLLMRLQLLIRNNNLARSPCVLRVRIGQSVFRFRYATSSLRISQVWSNHVYLCSLCSFCHISSLDNTLATPTRLVKGATFSVRALSESERLLVFARRLLRRLHFTCLQKI